MNVAIIAAGGSGTRAGAGRAKQFRELAGTPLIIHTLRRFEQSSTVGEVYVVLPAGEVAEFATFVGEYGLKKLARVVEGGATRTESIWRGLEAVHDAAPGVEIVAVHDGVRPFVTAEEIDRTIRAAEETGAAILATRATDTIKEANDETITRTLDRRTLWHAQTPQCFRYDILRRAYETALAEKIEATDDSALVERLGVTVRLVEGDTRNIKLTRPEDFALAEILLSSD